MQSLREQHRGVGYAVKNPRMDATQVNRPINRIVCMAAFSGRVRLADTPWRRLKGKLFDARTDDSVLVLTPCRDIHTFFMRFPLNVAFIDEKGVVVESTINMKPWRRLRNARAQSVLERRYMPGEAWYVPGECVGEIGTLCAGKDRK